MATATTTYTHRTAAPSGAAVEGGWFSRLIARMMAAQMSIARRRVNEQLRGMSDETLTRIGFTREQIETLRAGGQVDFPA